MTNVGRILVEKSVSRAGKSATAALVAKTPARGGQSKPRQPKRRTHAERSAETQSRLIDAAINCLHRVGYSATTTSLVADEAEVSRGAMTHQFPTKVDLMLAVVRAVFDAEVKEYSRILGAIEDPVKRYFALPSVMWEVLSRPSAIAVTEIMMASRSDPALAEGLAPMQAAIEEDARAAIALEMGRVGIPEGRNTRATHRLFVAAIRGLAIDALFVRDKAEIEQSVKMLERFLRLLAPDLKEPAET